MFTELSMHIKVLAYSENFKHKKSQISFISYAYLSYKSKTICFKSKSIFKRYTIPSLSQSYKIEFAEQFCLIKLIY